MKHSVRRLCQCLLLFLLPLLLSCGSEKKRYVIGVSQCSEDVWREKLNEELRIAALYYNDVDLRISSANDDVQMQTEQINKFVDEGVDLLIVAPGQVSISPAIDRAYEKGIPVIIFDRRHGRTSTQHISELTTMRLAARWANTWLAHSPTADAYWS